MLNCVLSPSHVVSWVRCGTWLYRFLIFAHFRTFKNEMKYFYWPFQCGVSFLVIFVIYVSWLSCFLVCSLQPCGHLLGKGWLLGSLCYALLFFVTFPCGVLNQVWYLIVSIPNLCPLTYLALGAYVAWAFITYSILLCYASGLTKNCLHFHLTGLIWNCLLHFYYCHLKLLTPFSHWTHLKLE